MGSWLSAEEFRVKVNVNFNTSVNVSLIRTHLIYWISISIYNLQILPTIIKLFASNDRAVRVSLLQHIDQFGESLSAQAVDEQVHSQDRMSKFPYFPAFFFIAVKFTEIHVLHSILQDCLLLRSGLPSRCYWFLWYISFFEGTYSQVHVSSGSESTSVYIHVIKSFFAFDSSWKMRHVIDLMRNLNTNFFWQFYCQ